MNAYEIIARLGFTLGVLVTWWFLARRINIRLVFVVLAVTNVLALMAVRNRLLPLLLSGDLLMIASILIWEKRLRKGYAATVIGTVWSVTGILLAYLGSLSLAPTLPNAGAWLLFLGFLIFALMPHFRHWTLHLGEISAILGGWFVSDFVSEAPSAALKLLLGLVWGIHFLMMYQAGDKLRSRYWQ